MEKFDITTHPKDRFKVCDLLRNSSYERRGWDNFIVEREQLELLNDNDIRYEMRI